MARTLALSVFVGLALAKAGTASAHDSTLPIGGALSRAAIAPVSGSQQRDTCRELEGRLVQEHEPEPALRIALAECYAQQGRTASAWAQFREAAAGAAETGQSDVAAQARTRAKALEPELSYLTVSTWKGQQVLVTSDDSPLDEAVLGSAIPLDPGQHVIAASAPGKRGWSTTIELGAHADHITVSVPVLPDDYNLVRDELRTPAVATAPAPESAGGSDGSVQRTLGLVAGAIGIAGVATGTVFGVKAASDWADAKAKCKPYPYCGSEGARLAEQAQTSALISNISFVTGIAGLTGGALLWFTAQDDERKAPQLGVGVGRVMLRGQL